MMQIRPLLAVTAIAGSLAFAAGCGGDDDDGGGGGGATTGAQTTETGGGTADAAQQTFASTCGGCHTLSAANTSGQVGPNLDDLAPDQARVEEAIESGPGSMPEGLLSGQEAEDVAEYVAANAGK
jgi:cytochrome c551